MSAAAVSVPLRGDHSTSTWALSRSTSSEMDSETEARSIADFGDIIYLIVSYLDPERPHLRYDPSNLKSARRSLARLARAHRNFTEPALKILWRRLPDDKPLADLLCALGIAERQCTSVSDSGLGIISELPRSAEFSYVRFFIFLSPYGLLIDSSLP